MNGSTTFVTTLLNKGSVLKYSEFDTNTIQSGFT